MLKLPNDIQRRLEELRDKMAELGYKSAMIRLAKETINELQQKGIHCVDRFARKLLDRVNEEGYLDILMEGRIALILAKNGLSEIFIEYSDEGPDIKANYNGKSVYFEVTRRRPNEEDERLRQSKDPIWISMTRTEIIIERIQEKLGQFESGEINVVVYCSETVTMGLPDIEEAFKYIKQEICHDPERYKKLSGILFTESAEIPLTDLWGFYLLENKYASERLGTHLAKKLKSLHK